MNLVDLLKKYVNKKSKVLSFEKIDLECDMLVANPYAFNEMMNYSDKYKMIVIGKKQYGNIYFRLEHLFDQLKKRLNANGILIITFSKEDYLNIEDYLKHLAMFDIEEIIDNNKEVICIFKTSKIKAKIKGERIYELRNVDIVNAAEMDTQDYSKVNDLSMHLKDIGIDKYEGYLAAATFEGIIAEQIAMKMIDYEIYKNCGMDYNSILDSIISILNNLNQDMLNRVKRAYAYSFIGKEAVQYLFENEDEVESVIDKLCEQIDNLKNGKYETLEDFQSQLNTILLEKIESREKVVQNIIFKIINKDPKQIDNAFNNIQTEEDITEAFRELEITDNTLITLNFELENAMSFNFLSKGNFLKLKETMEIYIIPYKWLYINYHNVYDDVYIFDLIDILAMRIKLLIREHYSLTKSEEQEIEMTVYQLLLNKNTVKKQEELFDVLKAYFDENNIS